ncbi:hypothetical protein MNBD_GAMMA21-2198 [hydrothermal vent metagenome]|uniref:Cell division inhibitor n=1 Tax=hydrothermal vent metagenome TaxID=652676 RepID=A0A3B1A347_9ZZZZ
MKQHKLDYRLPHSIVLYDHACGICRTEMSKLKKRDHLDRLYLVDISSPHFNPKLWGVTHSAVSEQMHVRTPAGIWLIGMPAIRHIYREVGLGWIWWSTKLPIISYASQRAYNWFARNRMDISKSLGMYEKTNSPCESCKTRSNDSKGAQ